MIFSDQLKKKMDQWIHQYPVKQSALIPILLEVQKNNYGWLSKDSMDFVAHYLEIPPIKVYEVVTFYTLFNNHPVGNP